MKNTEVHPLVSIIIRTCQRPQVLQRALKSVQEQTYKNVQVIVVEDGKNESEEFIKKNFKDLNLLYCTRTPHFFSSCTI